MLPKVLRLSKFPCSLRSKNSSKLCILVLRLVQHFVIIMTCATAIFCNFLFYSAYKNETQFVKVYSTTYSLSAMHRFITSFALTIGSIAFASTTALSFQSSPTPPSSASVMVIHAPAAPSALSSAKVVSHPAAVTAQRSVRVHTEHRLEDGTEEVVERRSLAKPFTAIDISGGGITVELTCQQEPKLEIIGEPEAVKTLDTDISDGRLEISGAAWKFGKKAIVVRVSTQTINDIVMSGANVLKASRISTDVLDVELSGACVLEASGKVKKLRLEVAGASVVNVKDLIAEKVIVEADGACKAVVYAEKYLSATVSGVSKVLYVGEPKEISKDVCGLAKVSPMK